MSNLANLNRPIFSSDDMHMDKHEFEPFLHPGRFSVAKRNHLRPNLVPTSAAAGLQGGCEWAGAGGDRGAEGGGSGQGHPRVSALSSFAGRLPLLLSRGCLNLEIYSEKGQSIRVRVRSVMFCLFAGVAVLAVDGDFIFLRGMTGRILSSCGPACVWSSAVQGEGKFTLLRRQV
jgi:hypothetical protein